VQIVYK
nr:Chain A, VQIVYK peptide corresponding to residues 306-311 in the tau protein [synthetic construct]2ON9_B Chain B, VQIVYK peptide corresponding to residues 306-311 in the tau protein [synthetic construct]3OVL_A Chain A, Microtubule-associated protein [synthetic construct]4NP8_A Chain A, Microtubule-associated protein tau [Homo sapiens]5K7N_Z Chain Z, VQIVYK [Homo sapiens]7FGL_C Chain C, VQIVYK [Homo sapiens]